jgi:hypothetical protein
VLLAACGARDMDTGAERVTDPREAALLRRRTLVLVAQALVLAALMTAIAAAGVVR